MIIILKYIYNQVRERKTQSAVMLLSILLSTTLLFVSFSIGSSYESAQQKMARGMAGTASLSVTAVRGAIDINSIPLLSSIKASVGMLKGSALYHEDGYYETIDLIAADLDQLQQINPPRLADGRKISSFTGNQVILPDRFTNKYGIERGDRITLEIDGQPIWLEVAEIAAYDTVFLRHTRGATALLPLATLSEFLGQREGYSEILIEAAKGISPTDLKNQLEAILSNTNFKVSLVLNEGQIAREARQKSMPFFLISFFCLTMSIFIINSSYKVITLERLPVIGTFRSVGATKKTVTQILLMESALYGCMGGMAGIPVGVVVLKLILQGMGKSLSQGIEIPVVISPLSIIFSFAVAVFVSLLSAWLPVRRASGLPIKDIILGTVEDNKIPRSYIIGAGIGLFVISVILPRLVSGAALYLAGGFSLLGLIAATILMLPPVANLLSKVLERVYSVIWGNEGKLAARNIGNNKNTLQNITLLFISISAVIVITVVGNFVTAYVGDVFRDANLEGFADGQMDQTFVTQVTEMEGIENVLPLYVYNNQIKANGIPLNRLEATDNLDLYSTMFGLRFTDENAKRQATAAFFTERAVLLSESFMEQTALSIGDSISLFDGSYQQNYLVVGSFKSRATDVEAVISSVYAKTDYGADSYGFLAYTAENPDAIMVQIRDLFGEVSNWSRTVEEFNTDALATVEAFLQPMHSMTYFILLLAAVGVINNLLINYLQKRRSVAMYKSLGLSNKQNIKITVIEGFSSGIIGAVIGIFVAYMEIKTIFLVAGPKISMAPELDAFTFLIAGAMGVTINLLGSAVPILKSRKMKLVEEIRLE